VEESLDIGERALTERDLGLKPGTLSQLDGTYSVTNGTATVRVNVIQGNLGNPFTVMTSLKNLAAGDGAHLLKIAGTVANQRLYNALNGRYGVTSQGAVDSVDVPLN